MEETAVDCFAALFKHFPKLFTRDLDAIEDYFTDLARIRAKYPRDQRDLLFDFEFNARTNAPQRGTRRAYRDSHPGNSTQCITSMAALEYVFGCPITQAQLATGQLRVQVPLEHSGVKVTHSATVKLVRPGQIIQPVQALYCEYQSAINRLHDPRITVEQRTILCRRFLVRLLQRSTFRISDAHFFYRRINNALKHEIADASCEYIYYSFDHVPVYFSFLLYAEGLRQRVLQARRLGCTRVTGRPHTLLFDRLALENPNSDQSRVLACLHAVFGPEIFNDSRYGYRGPHRSDDSKVIVCLNFNEFPRAYTDMNVSMLLFLALYFYQQHERHSYVGQDEAMIIYSCAMAYLGAVFATPQVLVHSGGLRLFYEFLKRGKIYTPNLVSKRESGSLTYYLPRDSFSNARAHRIFSEGSLEIFLGYRLTKLVLERNTMELPFYKIDVNPRFPRGLANAPWPHLDSITRQQNARTWPTPLGGNGRVHFQN